MLLNVLLFGNEVLRKKARAVDSVTAEVRRLAEDMLETMYYHDGLGLAAPQVGASLRLCVIDVPREESGKIVLVNPVIVESGPVAAMDEGCLSFPEITAPVPRATELTVSYIDLAGRERSKRVAGVTAQAVQHEIDHMDGVLLSDRMGVARRALLARKLRALRKKGEQGGHR